MGITYYVTKYVFITSTGCYTKGMYKINVQILKVICLINICPEIQGVKIKKMGYDPFPY